MITEMNAFHPTTKAAVAKALAEFGVELSASRVKKTPLADLIKMLDEANARPKLTTRRIEEAAFDDAGNVTVRTTSRRRTLSRRRSARARPRTSSRSALPRSASRPA